MLDLEEQEQLEELKIWWNRYRYAVLALLFVIIASVIGIQLWKKYEANQLNQAASLDVAMHNAYLENNMALVKAYGGKLIQAYGNTSYASRAALLLAKVNHQAGDDKSALAQIHWVVTHADDTNLVAIARLREASILLEQKQYPAALKSLVHHEPKAFSFLYDDMRGDIYHAMGQDNLARQDWTKSLNEMSKTNGYRQLVQMKLDALG
ncbi:MAG: tetratricopeptide repeat protein [Proteobacteria bacterium]|nr:tetratricopeptide repeat protein [Pseudomonadota bacterium]MDE3208847.1 tetratricopeptide repeat protein [Pseudomonadota bacterium]